jgi:hypothetical protein
VYGAAANSLEKGALSWDTGDDLSGEVERLEQVFRSEAGQ